MARTCHMCYGHSDDYEEANLKRCSSCQKVYYCSTTCQKDDWVCHMFDCKPRRPIKTADYLALAVRQNVVPEHPQTCEDYGFSRAATVEEKENLFGLYIGLIKVLRISAKTIHDWHLGGVLVDEIKAALYRLPEHSRGHYLPWFLHHQHIIAPASQPTTADKLVLAVRGNVFPDDPQTCEHYGFNRAITTEDKEDLLGLYTDLINFLKISPKTIHDWRVRGVLVDEIKAVLHKLPERSKGRYLPWFPQNQHIFAAASEPQSAETSHGVGTTADKLARAVIRDVFPEDPQTCEDYGFNRAITIEDKVNLLGLYTGLIMSPDISPKTIHDWRVRGVLVDEIKAAFYGLPERSRGLYFHWFLRNQHIVALAGHPLPPETSRNRGDIILARAWTVAGGSENDSSDEIRVAIARKPKEEQECIFLYVHILSKNHLPPYFDHWVKFGFASCTSQGEEWLLCRGYEHLIYMCTFKEFCDAYRTGHLLDLFRSKGVFMNDNDQLRDLLCGPADQKKSVWYLKKFVSQEESDKEEPCIPSVAADYGFINCRNDSERLQLKKVYKAFFNDHEGDPLALHAGAIKGNIHGFLSRSVHGLDNPKLRRLMKNSYPLPGL